MRTALPGEVNYDPVDRWTFGHLAIGAAVNMLGGPFWVAAAIGVGWEILERPARVRMVLRSQFPGSYAGQDTAENALWDVAANMAGWGAAEVFRDRGPGG